MPALLRRLWDHLTHPVHWVLDPIRDMVKTFLSGGERVIPALENDPVILLAHQGMAVAVVGTATATVGALVAGACAPAALPVILMAHTTLLLVDLGIVTCGSVLDLARREGRDPVPLDPTPRLVPAA